MNKTQSLARAMKGQAMIYPLKDGSFALIDAEDYDLVKDYKWYKSRGYITTKHDKKTMSLHRLIMNFPAGLEVDHINGVRHDCRKSNLRIVTKSQNAMNANRQCRNTSGYKGVSYHAAHKGKKKWRACIGINRVWTEIGHYLTALEAAQAYNARAIELFGEYARINDLENGGKRDISILERSGQGQEYRQEDRGSNRALRIQVQPESAGVLV